MPSGGHRGKPVSGKLIPVLWLCGPAGVGKTNFYPDPAADPGRYRMQAGNLGAVVAAFQAAGARCVVVSGVVDPAHGVYSSGGSSHANGGRSW